MSEATEKPASDRLLSAAAARLLLTVGALVPYWRLLSLGVLFVPDDNFTSDLFNGELPGRLIAGRLLRQGHWPVWTSSLCAGLPLAGLPADPLGLAFFTFLPPAPALDLYVVTLLLIAAHGAYALAQRFGADRLSATLGGIAFAGSGYFASQIRHLSITATVVWLPVGLVLLDRALDAREGDGSSRLTLAKRAKLLAFFGLVFGVQALSGFPQSAYICGWTYVAFIIFRAPGLRRGLVAAAGLALAVGAAVGAVVLLPLAKLDAVSDRSSALGYAWSTMAAYYPLNLLTFFVPYINGDISTNTYGYSIFWEDYGYVGLATVLLAIFAMIRERRRRAVAFLAGMTLVAYLLVLGRSTEVFHAAYYLLPGLKTFRLPTRFLIVVDLGLAILGALGLSRLQSDLRSRWRVRAPIVHGVALAVCLATVADLGINQTRLNPMVPAAEWLAPPPTVAVVHAGTPEPRTLAPGHHALHAAAFQEARGWSDLSPYYRLRDVLAPDTGAGYWNTASADCYAGISARWSVDVWGDHNRAGLLVGRLARPDVQSGVLRLDPRLPALLGIFGVTHVLSALPEEGASLALVSHGENSYVYRVDGARRARFVPAARAVASDEEAAARLLAPDFDPDREVLLSDAPATAATGQDAAGGSVAASSAEIVRETETEVDVDVNAPSNGFLLLADTYYPGWTALVDDRAMPAYRANIAMRAVAVPQGRHRVRFVFNAPGESSGVAITGVATLLLLTWAGVASYAERRARHIPIAPSAPITT